MTRRENNLGLLMRRFYWIALIVLAVLAALFASSFLFSASYQICAPDDYTHAKECTQHHLGPFIIFWIVGEADAHNGLVTAVATVFMAGFTATLWFVTNKAVGLARAEFNASHRPKIRVRQFRTESKTIAEDYQVYFMCVNVGESPCDVLEIAYQARKITFDERPILIGGKYERVLLDPDTRLVAGEPCEFCTELFRIEYQMGNCWDFAGYIRYRDTNGVERLTGFWQRFDRLGWPMETPQNYNFIYED